jgi:hypothetical protein
MTLVLGLLLAGTGAASAQTAGGTGSILGSTSNGLQTNAPALMAPTEGDPLLSNPASLEPTPTLGVPAPRVPAMPQLTCVTLQCGLPVSTTPLIETEPRMATTSQMPGSQTMGSQTMGSQMMGSRMMTPHMAGRMR